MDPGAVLEEFRAAMAAAGIATSDELIPDGKLHRFYVDGDTRGKENGWYVLHADEYPTAVYGTWKNDEKLYWHANPKKRLSLVDIKDLEKRIADRRKEFEAGQAHRQMEAAARAKKIWDAAPPAPADHGYLVGKQIPPAALRLHADCLVVPMRLANDPAFWSLQFIDEHGNKNFLSDGRTQGCYWTIASGPPDEEGQILICEGYATGATLHAATGLPVVVAFNAGNLLPAAQQVRTKFPAAQFVFCADNDQWTDKNPGIRFARLAAIATGGLVCWPAFPADHPERPTDFNDLARLGFLEDVRNRVNQAVPPQGEESGGHEAVAAPVLAALPPGRSDLPVIRPDESPQVLPAYIEFPHLGAKGKPLATIENVDALLQACNITARYDVIRKDLEITIPYSKYLIDTARNDKMTYIVSRAAVHGVSGQRVAEYVSHIAGQNPYNPAAEWILSKPWDERSRLQEFYNTITAVNEEETSVGDLKETLIKRWMISAVGAVFEPEGISAHGVLVLQGEQYLGKTQWFKSLVPKEFKLIADGKLLDPKDKDSVFQAVTKWIVELGELDATFKKTDVAQLKSFLTKDQDILRRPYARTESEFARRTVFFGSVNPEDYLSDPTGNRRFWTIACSAINHTHRLDMQQIWAEFHSLYAAGEGWYLTHGEMMHLNTHNRAFEAVNAVEELITQKLAWDDPQTLWKPRTATEIALAIGLREPNEKHLKQVARAIREKTGQTRSRDNGRYVYKVPAMRGT